MLKAVEMKYLKRSCGLTEQGQESGHQKTDGSHITEAMEIEQLEWFGHLNRRQEEGGPTQT